MPLWRAQQLKDCKPHRERQARLSPSEVMTIVILFQLSGFCNFKTYYTQHVCRHLGREFPELVSYQRFVELQSTVVMPLAAFLQTRFGTVNDQLKNICQIEHMRHRSLANFMVNLLATLIAYTYQEKKPSLNLRSGQIKALPAMIF